MTEAEIEAAYRYQESQYRKMDALRQLNCFIFGHDDPNFEIEAACLSDFEERYGVSYSAAQELIDIFIEKFYDIFDCNVPENDIWQTAIEEVLHA